MSDEILRLGSRKTTDVLRLKAKPKPKTIKLVPKGKTQRLGSKKKKPKRKKKEFATIASQLQRRKDFPTILKIASSPTLTAGLAGGLTLLTTGSPLAAAKVFGLTGLGLGVVTTSPRAVEFIKQKARPVKAGEALGGIIEDIGKEDKKTITERIKGAAKTAGLVGAGVAAAGVGAVAVKKIIEKSKDLPSQVVIPDVVAPALVGGSITSAQPVLSTPGLTDSRQTLAGVGSPPVEDVKKVIVPTEKPPRPINVTQKVNVKVNQKVNKAVSTAVSLVK